MEIRKQGFAVSCGEWIPGAMCVSAPVYSYTVPAVVSVIGPEYRLKAKQNEVIAKLKDSTSRISRNITEIYGTVIPRQTSGQA